MPENLFARCSEKPVSGFGDRLGSSKFHVFPANVSRRPRGSNIPSFRLQPVNPSQRQYPLKDRRQADQNHKQFEKVCEASFIDKLVNGPKTNCTYDANNQDTDQD